MGLADGVAWERHSRAPERRTVAGQQSGVSPSETIEKAMEGKNRIQGMVRSIDQYRNGQPKAVADGSYAQVLYALTDYKHDVLVLWDFAVSTARQAEALQRENAELRGVMKECHAALKMIISPGDISGSTVLGAFAAAKSAESRARALLGGENAGN